MNLRFEDYYDGWAIILINSIGEELERIHIDEDDSIQPLAEFLARLIPTVDVEYEEIC